MTTPVQRQVAERQLKLFERQMLQAAEAMHEPDPQATVADAVSLAGHAALGVACDPGLLHLLRINFFFDRGTLPHWVEASLLLSPLCHEEGADLYAMDAALRDLLLQRLAAREGPARLRSVATLLWQYTERHTGWQDRSELRHAQQLTALNFLAPDKAGAWLDEADAQRGRGRLDATWFIAMRADLPRLPAGVRQDGDVGQVCTALLQLVPDLQRGSLAELLRSPRACHILGNTPSQMGRWRALQFLLNSADAPSLLQEFEVDVLAGETLLWPLVGGARSGSPLPLVSKSTAPAQSAETAVVLHSTERLGMEQLAACCHHFNDSRLFLLHRTGDKLDQLAAHLHRFIEMVGTGRPIRMWSAGRYNAEELHVWLQTAGSPLQLQSSGSDTGALVAELLAASDNGTPERLFEQICLRAGVRWPDVVAEAASRFQTAPPATQALERLAADYERVRATQTSGGPRTAAMEAIAKQMREIMQREPHQPLQTWQESARSGERLLAVVLLRLQPSAQACTWLGERLSSRQPFMGYHAALALREAATTLPDDQLDAVAAALEIAVKGLGPSRLDSTDRGGVLKQARLTLQERRSNRPPDLSKLPLLIWNQTLLPGATRSFSTPFASMFKALQPPFVAVFGAAMQRKGQRPVVGTLVSADFQKTEGGGLSIVGDRRVSLLSFGDHKGKPATASVAFEETREDEHTDATYWDRLERAGHALSRVEPRQQPPFAVSRSLAGAYAFASWVNQDDPAAAYDVLAADRLQDRLRYLALRVVERIRRNLREPVPLLIAMPEAQRSRFVEIIRRLRVHEFLEQMLAPFSMESIHVPYLQEALPDPGRSNTMLAAALAASPHDEELWAFAEPWLPLSSEPRQSKPEALKLWPNGSTLRIRFLGGSRTLRRQVIEAASPWFEHANLNYRVLGATSQEVAEIRISFDRKDGSWSYLGTDALTVKPDQATMNLGFFGDDAGHADSRRSVLKEFGHALGLIQEHQNPNAQIDWAREAVVSQLSQAPNNWTVDDIERQWLTPVNVADYREFDPRSVMLYRVPAKWLRSGKAIGGASVLSASDKRFIARLYPRTAA